MIAIPAASHPQQFNIAWYCTTRHCLEGRSEKMAFRWIDAAGQREDFSFGRMETESNRMAEVLLSLGCQAGDVVFTFLPKMPQQFFSFLGTLKIQAIAGSLFANFGEEALIDRMADAGTSILITKKSLLKKVKRARRALPMLKFILVLDLPEDEADNVLSLPRRLAATTGHYEVPITSPSTPSVLHYTSGSTGKPKGVQHRHQSLLIQAWTTAHVLGLRDNDQYWCTADQGWVTGISYGIIGPWALGITQLHFGGAYDAAAWMRLLEEEQINVWYTAPTALRMLMREEPTLYTSLKLEHLRHIFSVGEPLNPEVVRWGQAVLHKDIYDTWFQTETGSIMVCNRPGIPVVPGSMGKPVEKVQAEIISDEGVVLGPAQTGNLCLKAGWDSMFTEYRNHPEVYQHKFKNGYYYSGDLAWRDKDGYFWFVGRNDDVINTAGHLISPFEIESALLECPEIAESAVIGAPDELLFEKVVAFVRLKDGVEWTEDLAINLRLYLSNKLSTIATPQDIRVVDEVPKNKSGKIMRRVLRAVYLGQDPGDVSTLEL